MTIQERLKAQEERHGQIKTLADAATGREFDEAEQRQWDDLNTAYDDEKAALDREARTSERDTRMAELDADAKQVRGLPGRTTPSSGTRGDRVDVNAALRGWAAGRRARTEDLRAARSMGIDLESNELEFRISSEQGRTPADIRALNRDAPMSGLSGPSGAYLQIPQFAATFDEAMLDFDDMRIFADVIRTDNGNAMFWPGGDDTANEGEWLAVDQETDEEGLTFSTQQWNAHVIGSKAIRVDRGLLQDASYDLVGRIGRSCGTRIGRGMARAHAIGNGVGQPMGIVPSATLGKTCAATGAFTFDEVMDLIASVDTAYAKNAKFLMHRLTKWEMRKKKDATGRYLWEPQLQTAGQPDNCLGHQIVENTYMSSALTTGEKLMLFGDLSYYKIRDVSTVTVQRLVEKYATKNQDAFLAFARTDGMLLNNGATSATKPVKYLALA